MTPFRVPGPPFSSPLSRLMGLLATMIMLTLLIDCGGQQADDKATLVTPAGIQVKAVVLRGGLSHPWSMAFLPDGSMLVTERAGQMRQLSADGLILSAPIGGLPTVAAFGQGGLLDVQIDPDYNASPWVYWTYSEPGAGSETGLAGTAVARGQLSNGVMVNVQVIFRQSPKVSGGNHFGARLVFGRDKNLFITLGERQQDDPANPGLDFAQNLGTHLGKVVRIQRDGSLPVGNPDFGVPGAKPEIWSLGHRNPQGAALHPTTGELWLSEHGPQGGDEINRVLPAHNYGWPIRSYGCPYGSTPGVACRVGGGTHAPQFDEPLAYWVPLSIAPSGMAFNTGGRYPGWEGNLFVGSLAGEALWRLTLDGNAVTSREALFSGELGRIRDVRQGPDGWLYLLTDSDQGTILRLTR